MEPNNKKLTFDSPTRLPELTQNLIRLSHGHSTPSLKISCKSVQPLSRNVADKETNKETKKSLEYNTQKFRILIDPDPDPDRRQNLIDWSLGDAHSSKKSSKSLHTLRRYTAKCQFTPSANAKESCNMIQDTRNNPNLQQNRTDIYLPGSRSTSAQSVYVHRTVLLQ